MVQALTYGRPVFDTLIQLCGPGDLAEPFVCVDDRGVWIGEPVAGLDWTPLCDLVGPGSPDPLSEPSLPFPFTAAQLAAFLMDGWGYFLREAAGEWADGPDEALLLRLSSRYGKVREVLQEAYRIFREAAASVAPLDSALEEDAQRLWAQRRNVEREANQKTGWRERGITEEERSIRLARARKSTATIVHRHKEAKAKADTAYLAWRRAMVRHLLAEEAAPRVRAQITASMDKWSLKEPRRVDAFAECLIPTLKAMAADGSGAPTARAVMEVWKKQAPSEVLEVIRGECVKYIDAKGNTSVIGMEALEKRIGRLIDGGR